MNIAGPTGNGILIPPGTYANFFVYAYGQPRILRFAADPVDTTYDPRIVPGAPMQPAASACVLQLGLLTRIRLWQGRHLS